MKVMCISTTRTEADFDRFLGRLAASPPDYFQVRDRAATDRIITARLERAIERLPRSLVFANARFDLALGTGAAGVVLPESGLPVAPVRMETPRGFLIGKSTHSAAGARLACEEGADLVILGPIFETPSKAGFGPPLSPGVLEDLSPAPEGVEMILIGGIDLDSMTRLAPHRDRFTGVAAIRAFESEDASAVVAAMQAM